MPWAGSAKEAPAAHRVPRVGSAEFRKPAPLREISRLIRLSEPFPRGAAAWSESSGGCGRGMAATLNLWVDRVRRNATPPKSLTTRPLIDTIRLGQRGGISRESEESECRRALNVAHAIRIGLRGLFCF